MHLCIVTLIFILSILRAAKLIGTVISEYLRSYVKIRLLPRTTTFFQPEQRIQPEFSATPITRRINPAGFLDIQGYTSITKPLKYYTDARDSSGGERAQTVTRCSRSCVFAQSIISVSSFGSWHFGQINGSTSYTFLQQPCPALFA